MYRLGVFNLDHSFTHHFCALKNIPECPNHRVSPRRGRPWEPDQATSYLQTSYYHTSVAIPLPLPSPPSLRPLPFITAPHSPQFPNNNISVSASSLDFPHLMQPRPHLQLSGGHSGRQLDDTANSHACSAGRVQLIPNGVTVHLSKQSAEPSEERERRRRSRGRKRGRRGVQERGERANKQIREEGLAQ